MDCLKLLTLNMIYLRDTEDFMNLLEDIILQSLSWNSWLTYGQIGSSRKFCDETYRQITLMFVRYPLWKSWIESFENIGSETLQKSSSSISFNPLMHDSVVQKFHKALEHT